MKRMPIHQTSEGRTEKTLEIEISAPIEDTLCIGEKQFRKTGNTVCPGSLDPFYIVSYYTSILLGHTVRML